MHRGRHPVRFLAGVAVHGRLVAALGPTAAHRHADLWRRHASTHRAASHDLYDEIWADAARAVGATLRDRGGGRLEAQRDGRTVQIDRSGTGIDSQETFDRLLDKAWTHARLADAGLRIPRHRKLAARDIRAAAAFLRAADGAIVVKPAGGTGAGWGITCGVRRPTDLVLAMLGAGRYCSELLVEQQAPGDMYRVLVLDDVVIDVVRRGLPTVTGDGRSSIRELIEAENRLRMAADGDLGLMLLRADLDCVLHLRGQGLRLRSVPEAGRVLTVKTSSSESQPADSATISATLDPALAEELRAAARAVGLRLAGIDVVTPSLHQPLRESGGAVIEVNANPGLRYHYQVQNRDHATPVARLILQHLLDQDRN